MHATTVVRVDPDDGERERTGFERP